MQKPKYVMAIDPGSGDGLGWAFMEVHGRVLREFGELKIEAKNCEFGPLLAALGDLLKTAPNSASIAYELVRSHSSVNAAHLYGAQQGIIELAAHRYSLPVYRIAVQTGKKALGHNASGKNKATVAVAAARAKGYDVSTDDEADAVGIALAACEVIDSEFASRS